MGRGLMPFPTDYILAYAVAAAHAISREVVADIKQSIATDCPQYHEHKGGHSPVGGPPYLETGTLQRSITPLVTPSPDGVGITVYTDVPYALKVEKKLNRPFMGPAQTRWTPQVIDRLSKLPSIP